MDTADALPVIGGSGAKEGSCSQRDARGSIEPVTAPAEATKTKNDTDETFRKMFIENEELRMSVLALRRQVANVWFRRVT